MWNILHVLTVIFVIAKLAALDPIVTWSWWLVLAPSLISFGIAIFMLIVVFGLALWAQDKPPYRF